jgi:hypothetical protein
VNAEAEVTFTFVILQACGPFFNLVCTTMKHSVAMGLLRVRSGDSSALVTRSATSD